MWGSAAWLFPGPHKAPFSSGLKPQDMLGFLQGESPPCTEGLGIVQGLDLGLGHLVALQALDPGI